MSELAPRTDFETAPAASGESTLVEQWAAIEDSARVVAMLAGRPAPRHDAIGEAQIGQLAQVDGTRSNDATQALAELVATMRAGLDALLGAHGTDADPHVAARRLWTEYERGRAKVLSEVAIALAR
ncbi:hypothetical protein [Alteriqipengyuania lutimaris]|uniref:Uncharacterized protein n=1 Tax=Alteriqipengyuania lutimaris TaxID=1538146 RepID=A0A395LIM3_9SPHN|nr:hypothetical protein [Alteriqipengyuania lutimaris]MBB3034252.1 hypothetical protein [Alteriqipengyuania lutimaris]RDS76836.1 hypothetical protein DL238_03905 [Alteriqipengyuania lutimaris]